MNIKSFRFIILLLMLPASMVTLKFAYADNAAEMAKKLQNPLANIKALMTDNAIGFNTGSTEDTSFGFQLQPVYAIDMPDKGMTLIPRAVIPVMGLEPGTKTPLTGQDGQPVPGTESVWGVSDTVVQLFIAPHTKSSWKWGVGPQISLPTHTDDQLKGPEWGAGVAGVLVGNLTDQLSFAGIAANHWGFDGNFNSAIIQPMLFYNWISVPGAYWAYNAVISADWKASSSDTWTVPLGVSIGRTFDMGGGNALDAMVGPYKNVVRPAGAADWILRFQVSWMFP